MRIAATTAFAVLAATTAFAQDQPARKVATEVAARVPLEAAFKGAPYSAETIVEGSQTLADGNRINTKTTGRVYRDGEGRTRREDDRKDGSVGISITDPVGGFSYSLDPVNKVAWRTPIGVGGAIMGKIEQAQTETRRVYVEAEGQPLGTVVARPASDEERRKVEAAAAAAARGGQGGTLVATPTPQGAVVARGGGGRGGAVMRRGGPEAPLEHKVLDGLAVEGRSTKTVIPAGQVGNEQPIVISDEQWRSTDLNVLVMTRHVDPRTGESSYRLTNIVRAEPDSSLFMVPPDYTVKDTGIRRMQPARK